MAAADADWILGGLLAMGASFADAVTAGSTRAHVDAQKVAAGSLEVRADTREDATARTQSGAGGIVAGSGSITAAKTGSATTAYVNSPDAATTGAGDSGRQPAEDGGHGGGRQRRALAVGVSQALAEQKPTATAYVWPGARMKAGSDLTIESRHETAAPRAGRGLRLQRRPGVGQRGRADATATPTVVAYVGAGAVLEAGGTSTVRAVNTNAALAVGDGLTVGLLVGVGAIESHSTASGQARAHVEAGAKVTGGNLLVETTTADAAVTETEASGGGLISIQGAVDGADSTAAALPVVRAFLADNSVVDVTGSVTIRAVATTDADAVSQGVSVGGVAVSDSDAHVDVAPDVQTYIGSQALVTADQDVLIETRYGQTVTPSDGSFNPAAVNSGTDTIVFSQPHGLLDGTDSGLRTGQRQYAAGRADRRTQLQRRAGERYSVRLGAAFTPGEVAADNDTIRFGRPHGLRDRRQGDLRRRAADADRRTQQRASLLRPSPGHRHDQAGRVAGAGDRTAADVLGASAVDGVANTITLAGHGFTNGQAVTYRARPPRASPRPRWNGKGSRRTRSS